MSNHVGMVMREDVAGWQSQWTPRASAQVGSERLRMQHNGMGDIRVTLGNTELYRGTDIDAAIKAWDGAGEPSLSLLPRLALSDARRILRGRARVVLQARTGDYWLAPLMGRTGDIRKAHVYEMRQTDTGDVDEFIEFVHPLAPD